MTTTDTLPKGTRVRLITGKHGYPNRVGQTGTILNAEDLYGGPGYAVAFPDHRYIVVLATHLETV